MREASLQKGLCQGGSDQLFQDVKKWKSPKSPRIGEESGSSKDTHMTDGDDTIIDNMSTQNFLLFFFLVMLHGLWDLSSPTKNRTWALGSASVES